MSDRPSHGAASEVTQYFAQELADLNEVGKRLSKSHPHLARHLAREANNPDIERLIEATAYLCAQVRARVDACAPQLTHELGNMMAPWVQRALPAAMVAGFDMSTGTKTPIHLPQGTDLTGSGAHRGLCFRTIEKKTLLPITVVGARLEDEGPKTARLTVSLKNSGELTYQDLHRVGLQFFIGGAEQEASLLAMALWHQTAQAQLHDGSFFAALPGYIERPDHHICEPLTPTFAHDPPMPRGIARLRDLFVLPQKYSFATFRLAKAPHNSRVGEDLAITFSLNKAWGLPANLQNISLLLNAVPALNLAQVDAIPLRIQPGRCHYLLRPQQPGEVACQVLAIEAADLIAHPGAAAKPLMPQHSYRWAQQGDHAHGLFYTFEPSKADAAVAHLQIHHASDVRPPLTSAALSARLWCHHGAQVAQLPAGALTLEACHPSRARAVNVTGTSSLVSAPGDNAARAALLALIAQRGRSALTAEDVRRMLRLLQSVHPPDSAAYRAQTLVICSIVDVRTQSTTRLWRGAHVLCLDITLELDPQGFHHMAHAYLFADCLTDLWADTLPIHGVLRMRLICPKLGRSITWPLRAGQATFGNTTCTLEDERR